MKKRYTIYNFAQNSPEWHKIRSGKLTMSNAAAAIGTSPFDTPAKLAQYLTGKKERVFSENSLKLMKMGLEREEEVRNWYCEKHPQYKVQEIGFATPSWSPYIGCSPDGLVNDDGILEIKHVVKFYNKFLNYYNYPKGKKLIDYIPETHYAQIQGNMGILRRKWCDYIVKEFDGDQIMLRIPFDSFFWSRIQKPRMLDFVEKYLKIDSNSEE